MKKKITLILVFSIAASTWMQAQDSTKLKSFDFSRLKPIVHLFANAEYNPSDGVPKDYSFWMGRVMFGFQYQFGKHWTGRVLIDRTRLPGSMNTMYVKVANLQWTPDERLSVEAGAINQNNFIPFEAFWGYRFVAETFQDRYYAIPSTDLGIAAYYRISKRFSLDAAITNGEGPRFDQDSAGRIKLAGGLNFFLNERFRARMFYHLKSSGEPGYTANEQLFNASIGYQAGDRARFGADFTYISGNLGAPGFTTFGGTLFGCVRLYKSLNYVIRLDRLIDDNRSDLKAGYLVSQNALITGFSVSPVRGVTLCLNYQGSYRLSRELPPGHRLLFSFEYKI